MVAVLYMSLFLVRGFSQLFEGVPHLPQFAFIAILRGGPVDIGIMNLAILLIIITHGIVTGLIAKAADGGTKYGAVTHFVLTVWVAAIASIVTQYVMLAVFPGR